MQSDGVETPKTNGMASKRRILGVSLLLAVVILLSALVGGAWLLNSQGCAHTFCPNLDIIFVNSVTLGSNGWVTFNMTGAQAYSHNITKVTVIKEPYPGYPQGQPLGSVYLSSNNFLPAKGKLILSVQFQGVTWQPMVNYTFYIVAEQGPTIGVQGCLSGC